MIWKKAYLTLYKKYDTVSHFKDTCIRAFTNILPVTFIKEVIILATCLCLFICLFSKPSQKVIDRSDMTFRKCQPYPHKITKCCLFFELSTSDINVYLFVKYILSTWSHIWTTKCIVPATIKNPWNFSVWGNFLFVVIYILAILLNLCTSCEGVET